MKRTTLLTYIALSTLAIGQPLLDLYGRNITIFSASKINAVSAALFVVAVLVLPGLVAWLVVLLSGWFGPLVRRASEVMMMRLFLFLFALAILSSMHVRDDFVVYPVALLFAYIVGRAVDRSATLQTWLNWLKVFPAVVLVVFLVQAQAVFVPVPVSLAKVAIAHRDIPVLQVIFDEFPLYSILDSSGNVNAARFPGLATLSREGTWYRNSAAVSNFTHQAVPAILTSSIPSRTAGPLYSSNKRNVFTLLGGQMPVDGFEPVTSMCPTSLCAHARTERTGFSPSRFFRFLRDARAVYERRVVPRRTAEHVPQVDTGWAGFGVVAQRFKGQMVQGNLEQQDNVLAAARNIVKASRPVYQLVHALMPHSPWYVTPDDRISTAPRTLESTNADTLDGVRDTYQRFLYQAVASDSALLAAINELKAAGRWSDTLVVFTADHGISFIEGRAQRITDLTDPEIVDDVYRVPTFIKYPGQAAGVVSDCPISNLDLLPTIADVLGVSTTWTFSGMSLARGCPSRGDRPIESASGEKGVLRGGFERTLARAAHYSMLVNPDGEPRRIAAVGSSAELIGTRLSGVSRANIGISWTLSDRDLLDNVSTSRGAAAPAVLRGGVLLDKPLPKGTEGIFVIDGIAAGIVGEFGEGKTFFGYLSVLDYTLLTQGKHSVELVLRDGATGALTEVGPPRAK